MRLAALAAYDILDTPAEQGFDDIVQMASDVCETSVALVSLVGSDRQWFKARIGFEPCETDLNGSVCAFALVEPDLLIIPDLTADERTKDNYLVTGEPHIRFYAGAPLRTANGQVLGSLCVIDGKARPEGLTKRQADVLRNLARQVIVQLDLRRALSDRDDLLEQRRIADDQLLKSQARLLSTAEHWRNLFQRLSEGFIVGKVIRDAAGKVVDWRYMEVNKAWGELVGVETRSAIGRTIREVLPGIEDEWVDDFAHVVENRQSIQFIRQVGTLHRWYEGRAFPLEDDQFGVLFLEVTDRVQADRRRAALTLVGDRLRELRSVGEMTAAVARIVGEALHVSRAGFGRLIDNEAVEIEPDWTAPGVPGIAGRHRFADYGDLLKELLKGDPLVIDDVFTDPRTSSNPTPMVEAQIRALVNIPVMDRGKAVAVLICHDLGPRRWAAPDLSFLRNVADRLEAAVARLQAEDDQRILNHELSHRMKNTFAMVQAIASQTLRSVADQAPVEAFAERIQALSTAHDVLLQENWTAAKLKWVVRAVLKAMAPLDRFDLAGPEVELGPRATLSVSLLLHELSTNALKYGALSSETGLVAMSWRLEGDGEQTELVLAWRESGGPAITEPTQKGFGSRLIRLGLIGTGGTDLRYTPLGLQAEFRAPLAQIQTS